MRTEQDIRYRLSQVEKTIEALKEFGGSAFDVALYEFLAIELRAILEIK